MLLHQYFYLNLSWILFLLYHVEYLAKFISYTMRGTLRKFLAISWNGHLIADFFLMLIFLLLFFSFSKCIYSFANYLYLLFNFIISAGSYIYGRLAKLCRLFNFSWSGRF